MKGTDAAAGALLEIAARRWFDDLADRGIIVTDTALDRSRVELPGW